MDNKKTKIPYKLFFTVVFVVAVITFFIMNYNPVPITFIFFNIKVPLTLLFFILMLFGAFLATLYWKNKYNKLYSQLERTKKLLFAKEEIDLEISNNEDDEDGLEI